MFERDPHKLFPHDYAMRLLILPFIPGWVSPNSVTVIRMILIPVMFVLLLLGNFAVAVPLFLFGAFTDILDGSLARVRKQITAWGTFYDPLTDKMMIGSALLFLLMHQLSLVLGGLMVLVEILIAVGGYVRRKQGVFVGANLLGKIKMHFQVYGVTLFLIGLWLHVMVLSLVAVGIFVLSLFLAVASLLTYGN